MNSPTSYKIVNRRKLRWIKAADRALELLAPFRTRGQSQPTLPEHPARILAVRVAYLGDIVMTLPALVALKTHYPAARLDLLTSSAAAQLLRGHPAVDRLISFDAPWFYKRSLPKAASEYFRLIKSLRAESYDLAIDFRADLRNIALLLRPSGASRRLAFTSGGGRRLLTHPIAWPRVSHKIEFHLDLLREAGIPAVSSDPRLVVPLDEIYDAKIRLAAAGYEGGAIVVMHPGARVDLKRWDERRFAETAAALRDRYHPFIAITGSASEANAADAVLAACPQAHNFCGELSICQFASLLAVSHLLIGNDSAPIHIAAAVGTPTIAIFGPSKPDETAPRGRMHQALYVPCDCRPACDESRCEQQARECLSAITPAMVMEAAAKVLGASSHERPAA